MLDFSMLTGAKINQKYGYNILNVEIAELARLNAKYKRSTVIMKNPCSETISFKIIKFFRYRKRLQGSYIFFKEFKTSF